MHFYGGVVGTALAAVRKNTKFNRHIVGATLRGRPENSAIHNIPAQSRAGACSRRKNDYFSFPILRHGFAVPPPLPKEANVIAGFRLDL